jgi:hypothetical protein
MSCGFQSGLSPGGAVAAHPGADKDSDAAYAEFSAQVVVVRDAARGAVVTPTAEQEQKLNLLASQEVIAEPG